MIKVSHCIRYKALSSCQTILNRIILNEIDFSFKTRNYKESLRKNGFFLS